MTKPTSSWLVSLTQYNFSWLFLSSESALNLALFPKHIMIKAMVAAQMTDYRLPHLKLRWLQWQFWQLPIVLKYIKIDVVSDICLVTLFSRPEGEL